MILPTNPTQRAPVRGVGTPPPLPDDLIEHLRQLQGESEKHQWIVGDFLVGVVDELSEVYERSGVRRARTWLIRHMANRVGVDETTLRDRECVARFFPEKERDSFPFSWSQWRALKSAGENWREYAEWAADNLPAPVSVIRQKIKANGHSQPRWKYKLDRVMELIEEIIDDPETPQEVRAAFDDKLIEQLRMLTFHTPTEQQPD